MTKQNGFCHWGPSLVNVFMACCVSGSHPQAAGSSCAADRRHKSVEQEKCTDGYEYRILLPRVPF